MWTALIVPEEDSIRFSDACYRLGVDPFLFRLSLYEQKLGNTSVRVVKVENSAFTRFYSSVASDWIQAFEEDH